MNGRALLIAGCLTLAACSQGSNPGATTDLEVFEARIREPVPGQDRTAGYFSVRNGSETARTLVSADSDDVRAIEFHTTIRTGDTMRMQRLSEVEIPPGETIHFQPGGRHLMLFGVRSINDPTEIRLRFADGREMTVEFRRIGIGE
jgi:copper(I)-binding protein